ncbi:MAG: prepilin-type N-terminal cleavage/methylation domain-containing protein [Deltaproteobacteria bacterium]|nr:prepilin-type N-terminal cleavage/methylation domain-containing protein [Deltaproteobacteria bacterium]
MTSILKAMRSPLTGRLTGAGKGRAGFTLIELMMVLTIIAILASIAIPRYMQSLVKAREAALLEDLFQMRTAIDQHYADNGLYPQSLRELADKKYIRAVPVDPFTSSSDTWREVLADVSSGIYDVASGSDQVGTNGIPYSQW